MTDLPDLLYFSSVSGNTARLADKVADRMPTLRIARLPLRRADATPDVRGPYVLLVPTYGGGNLGGAVPKQVIRFLNDPARRAQIIGVIATGNRNFGVGYGIAGDIIAAKCHVPLLARIELFGTREDVSHIVGILESLYP